MSVLSERLRALRVERQLSLRQLARASEIPFQTIQRLERDAAPNPTMSTMVALARVLGVTVDYLLGTSDTRTCHGPGTP